MPSVFLRVDGSVVLASVYPELGSMGVSHASLIPRYEWLPAFDDSHRTPN
jgi:hypothetical protein